MIRMNIASLSVHIDDLKMLLDLLEHLWDVIGSLKRKFVNNVIFPSMYQLMDMTLYKHLQNRFLGVLAFLLNTVMTLKSERT